MCPTVTIRETYDLSTKQGKMTLIGVHTPTKNIIQRLYPGFCEQYKFVKIKHQNIRVASQARLPVGMAGVGTETGQVSPEDAFNPILYKAVSNASLSTLEYRLRGMVGISALGESVKASNKDVTGFDDEFNVYYSLLSNTRGWKVAHPMAGLSMRKLRPLVFEKWYNEGVNRYDADSHPSEPPVGIYDDAEWSDQIPIDATQSANLIGGKVVQSMRGRPHRMPAFNTKYLTEVATLPEGFAGSFAPNGMGDGYPYNGQAQMPEIAPVYTQVLVIPPSRTTTLYYRMVVETVVSFFGVQTMDEISSFQDLNSRAEFPVYWTDHGDDSKTMVVKENTISASDGATINKIMES